ncbi:hypothetical protein MASR1M65_09950 [Saprospiraceae bacterium]
MALLHLTSRLNGTGVLKRTVGNADVSCPVGNAAYNPAILKNAGTSDIYSLRVADDVFTNGDSGPALTEKVVDRTWYITEANTGGSNVEATFQWAASDELSGFVRSLCNVAHYTGGTWNEGTNGAASGSGPIYQKAHWHYDLLAFCGYWSGCTAGRAVVLPCPEVGQYRPA